MNERSGIVCLEVLRPAKKPDFFVKNGSAVSAESRVFAAHHWGRALLVLAMAWLWLSSAALAQASGDQSPEAVEAQRRTFIYFLFGGGGLVGVLCTTPILIMSVVAMALVVEHLITIRRSTLIPPELGEEVYGLISNGSFPHAEQQCKLRPSLLSHILLAGLSQVRLGYWAVEKAMEDASQSQAARLFRKIEFLSVLANISTMLGLFGTVVGLVIAFKRLADTQGVARASDLASGIYLAMMTTVEGLAVAIPCVAAYAVFKYRADQLTAETSLVAEYAFAGYKQSQAKRRGPEHPESTRSGTRG